MCVEVRGQKGMLFFVGPDSLAIYLGGLHDVVFDRVVQSFFENQWILPVLHNKGWYDTRHRDYPRFRKFIQANYPSILPYLPKPDPEFFAIMYEQPVFNKTIKEILGGAYEKIRSRFKNLLIPKDKLDFYCEQTRMKGLNRTNDWLPSPKKKKKKKK